MSQKIQKTNEVEYWTCQYHSIAVERSEANDPWCPTCMEERATLPVVKTMTHEQKVSELEFWLNERKQLTVPWGMFIGRVDELLGRAIYTTEMSPYGIPGLLAEMRNQKPTDGFANAVVGFGDSEQS